MHAVLAIYCETDIFWLLFSLTGCCVHHLCNIGCWSLSLSSLYTAQKGVFYVPLQIYWFYDDDVLTEGCSNRWTIKCFYVGMVYNAQRLLHWSIFCLNVDINKQGGKCERNKCLPVNNFRTIRYISAIFYVIWIYYMIIWNTFPWYQLLMQAIEAEIRSHRLGIVAEDLVPKYSVSDLCC